MLTTLLLISATFAAPNTCDINGDGQVNIYDMQLEMNVVLGATCPSYDCDLDSDGTPTVTDVQKIQNHVMGVEACPDLSDVVSTAFDSDGGWTSDLMIIDVDIDGDLDFFITGKSGGVDGVHMTSFSVALDLDGDGTLDLEAPMEALFLDSGEGQPFDYMGVQSATWPDALMLASALGVAPTTDSVLYVEADGDGLADAGFYPMLVVGELF